MAVDVPLRCSCGALRGVLRGACAENVSHVVCYCDDCQCFAHHLGGAERTLDAHGGTELFQTSPARVEIHDGAERLACLRLRPRGLLRWYAACCRTPVGNTLATRQIPFVGLLHPCLDPVSAGGSVDAVFGPVRGRAFGRFAKGDVSQLGVHDRIPPTFMLGVLARALRARLRGDHVRSPFFDPKSGEPVAEPYVLSEAELRAADAARSAA